MMNPPADDPTSRVQADAARHQVLVRVFPFQRHEVMGRLSVLRMTVATARRRLDRGESPGDEKTWAAMDCQLKAASADMAAMRWWDRPAGLSETPAAVLVACLGPIQSALTLRGHRVEADAPDGIDADDTARPARWPEPQAHLALLAAALHASDQLEGAWDWRLRLLPDGVSGEATRHADGVPDTPLWRESEAIRHWMASALAQDAGARLQAGDGRWRLTWPAGAANG